MWDLITLDGYFEAAPTSAASGEGCGLTYLDSARRLLWAL